MLQRLLLNIFLFIVLIAMLVIYLSQDDVNNTKAKLLDIEKENIHSLLISRDSGDIRFEKHNNDTWYMISPYQIKAHQFRINSLIKLSQKEVNKTYDASILNLGDYGLDKPRASISFNGEQVHFGNSNPLSGQRYLFANNKVSLVADETYPLVSAQAASLIDLHLLDTNKIHILELPKIHIKNDQITWQAPGTPVLTADQVQELLHQWINIQAFAVHQYMPRKRLGHITIGTDKAQLQFEISDTDPWLIIGRPDLNIEYHFDKQLARDLMLGPDLVEPVSPEELN